MLAPNIAKVDTFNDNTAPGGGFEAGVPGDGEDRLEAELEAAGPAPRQQHQQVALLPHQRLHITQVGNVGILT